MRKIVDLMLGRMAFFAGLAWLTALAALHLWPASWWLEIDSVRVADGIEGRPVLMHVERTIHRDFAGTWGVTVRSLTAHGSMVACAASAVSDYRTGADLPGVLTLGWWTTGRCEALPPGTYLVQTTWQIHGSGLIPAKTVQATSNPFVIHAGGAP